MTLAFYQSNAGVRQPYGVAHKSVRNLKGFPVYEVYSPVSPSNLVGLTGRATLDASAGGIVPTPAGLAWRVLKGADNFSPLPLVISDDPTPPQNFGDSRWTFALLHDYTPHANFYPQVTIKKVGGTYGLDISASTGAARIFVNSARVTGSTDLRSGVHSIAGAMTRGGNAKLYSDGVFDGEWTNSSDWGDWNGISQIGGFSGQGASTGNVILVIHGGGYPDDDFFAQLHRNPWQFAVEKRPIFFTAGAGGGPTSVSANMSGLAVVDVSLLVLLSPSITSAANINVTDESTQLINASVIGTGTTTVTDQSVVTETASIVGTGTLSIQKLVSISVSVLSSSQTTVSRIVSKNISVISNASITVADNIRHAIDVISSGTAIVTVPTVTFIAVVASTIKQKIQKLTLALFNRLGL